MTEGQVEAGGGVRLIRRLVLTSVNALIVSKGLERVFVVRPIGRVGCGRPAYETSEGAVSALLGHGAGALVVGLRLEWDELVLCGLLGMELKLVLSIRFSLDISLLPRPMWRIRVRRTRCVPNTSISELRKTLE